MPNAAPVRTFRLADALKDAAVAAQADHAGYALKSVLINFVRGELGYEVELGAGVGAAQAVFLEAGVPAGAPA